MVSVSAAKQYDYQRAPVLSIQNVVDREGDGEQSPKREQVCDIDPTWQILPL